MKKLFFFAATCLATISVMATQHVVEAGDNKIEGILASVKAGDTLVLQSGTYTEQHVLTFDKQLTLMAAPDARPVVSINQFAIKAPFEINGLDCSSNSSTYMFDVKGAIAGTLAFYNCSIHDGKARFIYIEKAVTKVDIDNCIFKNNTSDKMIYGYAETTTFRMTNSTIINCTEASPIRVRKTSNVLIDHCTFHKVGKQTIRLCEESTSTLADVRNCVVNCTPTADYAFYLYNGTATNCVYNNAKQAVRTGDAKAVNVINADPCFEDPANDILNFSSKSPLAYNATDGTHIGDPRWKLNMGQSVAITDTLHPDNMSAKSGAMAVFVGSYLNYGSTDTDSDTALWASWLVTSSAEKYIAKADLMAKYDYQLQLELIDPATSMVLKKLWGQPNQNVLGTFDLSEVPAGTYMLRLKNKALWTDLKVKNLLLVPQGTSPDQPGATKEIEPYEESKWADSEVVTKADAKKIADYTIPTYVQMWAAREAARADASASNLATLRKLVHRLQVKESPYCLIANINGDPQTHMAFNWLTNEGITKGQVQLVAKANASAADFAGGDVITLDATVATTKALHYAVSDNGIIAKTGMDANTTYKYESHKALATNLTHGTTYSYRVGYDTYWSQIATFQTAAAQQGDFSFLLMSDSHIEDQEYIDNARWSAEAASVLESDAKFCLFPGDFVNTGTNTNSEWEWERWFEESERVMLNTFPIVPTDGNHDDTGNLNYDAHFNTDNAFNQSCVVKPQFQGITYSFVYGDVLFLVFSVQDYWRGAYDYKKGTSTYLTTDVQNWFKDQIAAHPNCKYRVTVCHKGLFAGAGHQEDEEGPMLRATMLPVFKECEIDLALQAHDHCYEVMGPVNPDTKTPILSAITDVRDTTIDAKTNVTGKMGGMFSVDDGTLYFIGATCGRKRYSPNTREEMEELKSITKVENYFDLFTSRFGQPGAPTYTKITIKDDGIHVASYTVDNTYNKALFNEFQVVRTKPHTTPSYLDTPTENAITNEGKYIYQGQLVILHHGQLYNAQGQLIHQ